MIRGLICYQVSIRERPPSPRNAGTLGGLASRINAQLHRQLAVKDQALAMAEMKVLALQQELRLARIAKYGNRSETLSDLQLELLDLEPGVSGDEVAGEGEHGPLAGPDQGKQAESANKPQDKRRKHPGRQKLPSHLPREEQIIACSAEQCTCGQCGQQKQLIGYEETEVLDVRPAQYFVRVIKREKRACKQCAEQGVRTAGAPERIAPKSLLSDTSSSIWWWASTASRFPLSPTSHAAT